MAADEKNIGSVQPFALADVLGSHDAALYPPELRVSLTRDGLFVAGLSFNGTLMEPHGSFRVCTEAPAMGDSLGEVS